MRIAAGFVLLASLASCSPAMVPGVPTDDPDLPISCSTSAREALLRGWDLRETGLRHEALIHFERAHRVDPPCILADAHRAESAPGTDPGAHALLQSAMKRARALPEAERLQVEILAASRDGDSELALEKQRRLAELRPKAWRARYLHGKRLVTFKRWDDAEVELAAAWELSRDPRALRLRAWSTLDARRYEEARAMWQEYLALVPDECDALERLITATIGANDPRTAAEAATRAMTSCPREPRFVALLAEARHRFDPVGARAALRELFKTQDNPRSRFEIGFRVVYLDFSLGRDADAWSLLRELEAAANEHGLRDLQVIVPTKAVLFLAGEGKWEEAVSELARVDAIARALQPPLTDGTGHEGDAIRFHQLARVAIDAHVGSLETARAHADAFARDAFKGPCERALSSFAAGELAWKEGARAKAIEYFRDCADRELWCRRMLGVAVYQTVAATEADAELHRLSRTASSDPLLPWLRKHAALP